MPVLVVPILFSVRYIFDNCETANNNGGNFMHYVFQATKQPF